MSKDDCSPVEDGQTVTIPLAEYRGLMADRAELSQLRGVTSGPICFTQAHFRHDREVVAFLNENATTATITWLAEEARRRFGPDRAPGRAAVGRYVAVVREYMAAVGRGGTARK